MPSHAPPPLQVENRQEITKPSVQTVQETRGRHDMADFAKEY